MRASAGNTVASAGFVFRRCLKNCQKCVPKFLDEARKWMRQVGVADRKNKNIQIVLAEALNNIIEHGFERENAGLIEIDIEVSGGTVVIHLSDNGKSFTPPTPTQTPMQDSGDFDNLPEGGFGWFLIREITSSYECYRRSNQNLLILYFM